MTQNKKRINIKYNPTQGRIQDFKIEGGARKKIAPSGGRRENFGGISCEKSRFYAKKIIFFPILGGDARRVRPPPPPPPGSAPATENQTQNGPYIHEKSKQTKTKIETSDSCFG